MQCHQSIPSNAHIIQYETKYPYIQYLWVLSDTISRSDYKLLSLLCLDMIVSWDITPFLFLHIWKV
jgi:hypothetical protein